MNIKNDEVFLYVNYKDQSNYVKISFRSHDRYHLSLVKEAISASFEAFKVDEFNFYWKQALIQEKDLVKLIKAKQFCGHFSISLKEKDVVIKEEKKLKQLENSRRNFLDSQTVSEIHEIVDDEDIDAIIIEDMEDSPIQNKISGDDKENPKTIEEIPQISQNKDTFQDTNFNDSVKTIVKIPRSLSKPKPKLKVRISIPSQEDFLRKRKRDSDNEENNNDSGTTIISKDNLSSLDSSKENKQRSSKKAKRVETDSKNNDSELSANSITEDQIEKFKEYFNVRYGTEAHLIDNPTKTETRYDIINCAVEYLMNEFGDYPTSLQNLNLVNILIELFEPYRGIKNIVVKWIISKLANIRRQNKIDRKRQEKQHHKSENNINSDTKSEETDLENSDCDSEYSCSSIGGRSEYFAKSIKNESFGKSKNSSVNEKMSDSFQKQVEKFKKYFNAHSDINITLITNPRTTKNRYNIINCAVKYLINECGAYPTSSEQRNMVDILIQIFSAFARIKKRVVVWINDKITTIRRNATLDGQKSSKTEAEKSDLEDSDCSSQ